MRDFLHDFAKYLRRRAENNWDNVIVIDGQEGSGKSTLALLLKGLYDGRLNLLHVVYDGNELLEEMGSAPNRCSIMVDEGTDAAYKRLWYSDLNIALVQALAIARAKGFLLIVNIPRFQNLDSDIRNRFHWRFWTYSPDGETRGYAHVYKMMEAPHRRGDKWQEYVCHYRFPALPKWFEEEYEPLKLDNLNKKLEEYRERLKADDEKIKKKTKRQVALDILKENPKFSPSELANAAEISTNYARDIINTHT